MRIAHVLYGEILAPVVRSQTFPLIRALRERGHEVCLAAITSPRRLLSPGRYSEALEAARDAVGGNLVVLTHAPKHLSYRGTAARLRRALRGFSPEVAHCRQARATVAAGRAGLTSLLADLRGIRPEEYLLTLGQTEVELSGREARALGRLRSEQAEALERAAAVVCVSEGFREHLGGGERIRVVPNACRRISRPDPAERERLRREFSLAEDETAFVYSGSLAAWQCVTETVRLFREVRRKSPGSRFVLLTHHREDGEALLRREGVEGGTVRSLSPEETRARLPAFDFAFLLREENLVNRVASPVKFAEYLHAGLPVILTEGTGDASRWVAEHGLGVVLMSPDHEENANRVLATLSRTDPERCRTFARERLSFDRTAVLYEDAYRAAMADAGETES